MRGKEGDEAWLFGLRMHCLGEWKNLACSPLTLTLSPLRGEGTRGAERKRRFLAAYADEGARSVEALRKVRVYLRRLLRIY